ncbi:MAG TPA: alpha/beta hydrolase [Anaerolineales bacterium]|nr:alpha/beta hydrolase [Anaerolineales bacterium]
MINFLTIGGHRIAYTAAGSPSNPPVILIHGLMSHRGVWTRTMEALKDRFFCIAFDLPGFGDSDKPKNGDYAIAKQAGRTLEIADHFGFGEFTVIGHSMGGQIATYLAARLAPQRVHKLVSVDGVVTGRLADKVQNVTRRMVAVGAKFPSSYRFSRILSEWKPLAYRAFDVWFYKPDELPFQAWSLDRRMATNPEIALSTVKAWDSLNATNLTVHLRDILSPTLVIFGKQDGTVPVEQAYIFKEQLSSAQLLVIDNCGHFPMYEKFEDYMRTLEGFLKEP